MGVAAGEDEAVFTLKERTRQEKHNPTGEELAAEEQRQKKFARIHGSASSWVASLEPRAYPEFDTIYTGEFVFQVEGYSDGVRRKWADGKNQTVERLLDDVVVGIIALLAARKQGRRARSPPAGMAGAGKAPGACQAAVGARRKAANLYPQYI
jgi:hypothetical protein